MINMIKHSLILLVLLFVSVTFVSCERVHQVFTPAPSDMDTMDPEEMMDPEDTMDPEEMMDQTMDGPSVVINELMADNDNIHQDPQGDYDDWLELFNRTDSNVDLTGMYLSDKEDNPTKWQFPDGTMIEANGYLVVWLDEDHDDDEATEGLHANFKLSKSGELVLFVDTDAQGNTVLDKVEFGEQKTDVAYGRLPDGTGKFQIVEATPGEANKAQ